eukprot:PhF_6_TR30108/c0_g1_i1/m.43936
MNHFQTIQFQFIFYLTFLFPYATTNVVITWPPTNPGNGTDLCSVLTDTMSRSENQSGESSSIDLVFQASYQFNEKCELNPNGRRSSLTVMCSSSSSFPVVVTCVSPASPCFKILRGSTNFTLNIMGCTIRGAALDYNVVGGTLTLQNSTFDGLFRFHPINVDYVDNVLVVNTYMCCGR